MPILSKEQMAILLADNNTGEISAKDMRDIVAALFGLVTTPPSYTEGESYYNSGVMNIMGSYDDVILRVGREMHIQVVNNSAAPILKGKAVRHNGVASGIPQVELAIATSFVNARILGFTAHDIPIGETGIITVFGIIENVNTSAFTAGVPLYLSSTIAGELTMVHPDIISQGGGALISGVTGKLIVSIINNTSLPTVFGAMQGQTAGNDTYSLTTTVQDIDDYNIESSSVMGTDISTGVLTLPNDGDYRLHFSASISFASTTSTRSVIVEFYDITDTLIEFTYTKNIPRDATVDGFSFSFPFSETAGNTYKMRIKSNVAMSITFEDISFDIESISIL